jgi:cytochrome bd ubiquinol oxidase subunit II
VAFVFALATHLGVIERWLEVPWLFSCSRRSGRWPPIACRAGCGRQDCLPYAMTVAIIFLAAYLTLVDSLWPYMIPFAVTIRDAPAPPHWLIFMFDGAEIVVFPVVLIYTVAVTWIFRGKVRDDID